MRAPVLVAGPSEPLVSLDDLKAHLRVGFDDEDTLITALGAAAVAHFDGWHGILGRAIMPQTWSQEFDGWGVHKLAFPDVSTVTVVGVLDGSETPASSVEVTTNVDGVCVEADGGEVDTVRIEYVTGLPEAQRAAVKMAVKLLVGHWYENREAASEKALSAAPMAVNALVSPLKAWAV